MSLPRFHWIRIKKELDRVRCPSNWYQDLCFFFTSTAITLFLILSQSGSSLPEYQIPWYLGGCSASVILAIAFLVFDYNWRKISTSNIGSIKDYIKDIDLMFLSTEEITDTQRNELTSIEVRYASARSRGLDYELRSLGVGVIDRGLSSLPQFKGVSGVAVDHFSFIELVQANILRGVDWVNYDPAFERYWLWEYGDESVWYYWDAVIDIARSRPSKP